MSITMSHPDDDRFPFPQIPENIAAKYSVKNLFLRPFGVHVRDLDLDILSEDPLRISDLIRSCTCDEEGNVPDEGFFRELTIGKQIQCLIALALAGGSSDLAIPLKCTNGGCGQSMEIAISLAEINALQAPHDGTDNIKVSCGEMEYRIRKPEVNDLLFWSQRSYGGEKEATRAMVQTLLERSYQDTPTPIDPREHDPIPEKHISIITLALEENDPLINFVLSVACPDCGHEDPYPIDLESLALQRIENTRNELLLAIHKLASRYHWTESEIISLPAWRRSRYLSFCDKEEQS